MTDASDADPLADAESADAEPATDAAGTASSPDARANEPATPPRPEHADIAELGYEEARDELTSIVARLEAGRIDLEESMRLWERGEALAAHCTRWLDGAQARLEQRVDTGRATDESGSE